MLVTANYANFSAIRMGQSIEVTKTSRVAIVQECFLDPGEEKQLHSAHVFPYLLVIDPHGEEVVWSRRQRGHSFRPISCRLVSSASSFGNLLRRHQDNAVSSCTYELRGRLGNVFFTDSS